MMSVTLLGVINNLFSCTPHLFTLKCIIFLLLLQLHAQCIVQNCALFSRMNVRKGVSYPIPALKMVGKEIIALVFTHSFHVHYFLC